ncbi:MAG TPA: glycosyltransferase family 4 protein [Pyrinomonadaceae bacterium]|jgi:glycosyltransferase involved in cell wall biosynthesis
MSDYHFQTEMAETNTAAVIRRDARSKTGALAGKPRVLMVGMHLTKTRGGITTLIAEILKSPLKDDFEFIYIESQAEDFGKFGKMFLAFGAVFRFVFSCLLKRPKLVYVHLGSNASLYRESVFIILAKLFGKKTIAHFHAGDIDNYYPFQSRIGQKIIRSALSLSDKLIAVSNESARQLRDLTGSANISVITNAIDTSIFNNPDSSSKNMERERTTRLLFVGAVGKLKGERDLIKALAILRERKPDINIKVSLLGYGAENLKDYCEESGISELVEHLGAVSLSERIGFYQKADIFVLPTYAEAMPMSVIEAMAAGLAVIATNVGGIPELIEDGADGILFSPGDAKALADIISLLLENKNIRLSLGEKARQKAREQMDFKTYAEKLGAHLSAACGSETEI